MRTLNSERINDLFDHSRRPSDLNVQVTHGTGLVENEPVLNAQLAEKLVAVVTFLCISAHLCTHKSQSETQTKNK